MFEQFAAQAAQVVLQTLQQQGALIVAPAAPSEAPPADQPALPDTLMALWQGDRGAISTRDRHQLQMLAAEYDGATGGHGAYWVGRAILIADRCLAERGQALSVNYLRAMLRRWREEGSWGSDREVAETAPRPAPEAAPQARAGAAPPPDEAQQHPAVAAYSEALRETPNAVQAAQIAATVTDLAAWRQVLTDWRLNGWGERSVGKMLDRYQKLRPAAVAQPAPSVGAIHTYPGLTLDERDYWIRKFHAAPSAAEKRAVIARLEQEHPR